MKYVIASDIHGSAKYCRLLIEAFKRENADKLILLGDILYHGPRNPLPEEYSPKDVAEMLSAVKDKIICIRGNCDADVDLMVLNFPLNDSALISTDGLDLYLGHGHKETPHLSGNNVYISGHTHVPLKEFGEYVHLNPGSVSLPKENSKHGYILYENRKFVFKDIYGLQYDYTEISSEHTSVKRAPLLRRKIIKRKHYV